VNYSDPRPGSGVNRKGPPFVRVRVFTAKKGEKGLNDEGQAIIQVRLDYKVPGSEGALPKIQLVATVVFA